LQKEELKNENIKLICETSMYILFGKRCIDFLVSLLAIIILIPLFLIMSIIIKLDSRGPVIYKQKRIGKGKRDFFVYKFRTMIVDADKQGPTRTIEGDKRITRVGKYIRKLSLDELPQLLNVIKGDMSLVGYRPGLKENYTQEELNSKLFYYKPGITGLAQVNGRSSLSRVDKRRLEYKYCDCISLKADLKIIFKTVCMVIKREGVN